MTTLRSILCPIDFSEHSRHALRWAEALAGRHQAGLIVLTAVDPVLAEAARVRLGIDLAATEVEPSLRAFAGGSWRDHDGAEPAFHVRVGEPADVILDAAKGADLVVMGTTGWAASASGSSDRPRSASCDVRQRRCSPYRLMMAGLQTRSGLAGSPRLSSPRRT